MSDFLPPVVARLNANITEFSAKMAEARGEMTETATVGEESGKKGGLGLASGIAGGVAIAGAAIAAYAIKAGADIGSADSALAAHGDLTQKQATKIGDAFLNQGTKFTESGTAMVNALAPVAGVLETVDGHALTAAESLGVMSSASHLAEASGSDLASTTASLASILQTFHIKATGAAGVTDLLWNVSRTAGIGVDQLATLFGRLHSRLGEVSPSLSDMSATVEDLTQHGVTGRAAVSGLTTGLTTLLGGSTATTNVVKMLGLQLRDASGHFVGTRDVLAQLTDKTKGYTDAARQAAYGALFGKGAASTLFNVLKDGTGAYDKASAAATKHGTAQKAAELATANLKDQLKKLEAGLENVAAKVGEKLIPVLLSIGKWIGANVIPEIRKLYTDAKPFIDKLTAAFKEVFDYLGSHKSVLHDVEIAVGLMSAPFLAVGAAIVYAYTHFQGFRQVISDVANFITGTVAPLIGQFAQYVGEQFENLVGWVRTNWGAIQEAIGHVVHAIRDIVVVAVDAIEYVWKHFGDIILNVMKDAWNLVKGEVKAAIDFVRSIIKFGIDLINGDWGKAWDDIKNAVKAAWQGIWDIVKFGFGLVEGVFQTVGRALELIWDGIWGTIKTVASGIWEGVVNAAYAGINLMLSALRWLVNEAIGIINPILEAINSVTKYIPFLSKDLHIDPLTPIGSLSVTSPYAKVPKSSVASGFSTRGGGYVPPPLPGANPSTGGAHFNAATVQANTTVNVTVQGSVTTADELAEHVRTTLLRKQPGLPSQALWGVAGAGT